MLEGAALDGVGMGEVLTYSPGDRARERWLARAISDGGRRLGEIRDRIWQPLQVRRHHVVLDLNAGTGLLTWEAVRRVPEGSVWSQARDAQAAAALRQQAERLPELARPIVLQGDLQALPALLAEQGEGAVLFDLIVGRNSLTQYPDKAAVARLLRGLLQAGGVLRLAEAVPKHTQRLYALVDATSLEPALFDAWREAEEEIYDAPGDPMTNWDAETLRQALAEAGFSTAHVDLAEMTREQLVTESQVEQWFGSNRARPTYAQRLARRLPPESIAAIRRLIERQLAGQVCHWRSAIAYVLARP